MTTRGPRPRQPRRKFEIIGHRGSGGGPDENTRGSFRRALASGADRLETDVQLVDGELVLAHPPRRAHMTLVELLDLTDRPLVLHLKRRRANPWHDRRVVDRLVPLISGRRDVVVSSFWPSTLTYLKRHYPTVWTAFISYWPGYDLYFSHRLGVVEYHGWTPLCTARAAAHAHRKGIRLIGFVADSPRLVTRLRRNGLDGVITDAVGTPRNSRPSNR